MYSILAPLIVYMLTNITYLRNHKRAFNQINFCSEQKLKI